METEETSCAGAAGEHMSEKAEPFILYASVDLTLMSCLQRKLVNDLQKFENVRDLL